VKELYEVIFYNRKKSLAIADIKCRVDDKVIVKTSRGLEYGRIVDIKIKNDLTEKNNLDTIIRIATEKDYEVYLKILKINEEALAFSKEQAKMLNLNMSFISADMTFDKKQILLQFTADERVDFRKLAKLIAAKYRTRVELRQVGARDKAKNINGIGPCGLSLCCSTFLNKLDSITMNMAKNQGLALNPTKINGSCGRLMCCLTYENENYLECRNLLPEVGKVVNTAFGSGKVVAVDVLNLAYTVAINNELKEIKVSDNGSSKE